MNPILRSQSLSIGYPGHTVAADLNLHLTQGRLVCLLGPNGAGKSTLLRTLCAMQPPLAGQVLLNGVDIHTISSRELARLLSVVLTDRVQVGLLSAYELVSLGRYPYTGWNGRLSAEDHRIIRQSIEATGAQDLAARPVDELSDGERQKVLMARALAQQPKLLVLDEVTAFLDLPRRVDIMRTLRRLALRCATCPLVCRAAAGGCDRGDGEGWFRDHACLRSDRGLWPGGGLRLARKLE